MCNRIITRIESKGTVEDEANEHHNRTMPYLNFSNKTHFFTAGFTDLKMKRAWIIELSFKRFSLSSAPLHQFRRTAH